MSRVVKADDPEFTIAYVIREHMNKLQQAEDDKRAKLIALAPEMFALLCLVSTLDPHIDREAWYASSQIPQLFRDIDALLKKV
jgi:hypothetical protein